MKATNRVYGFPWKGARPVRTRCYRGPGAGANAVVKPDWYPFPDEFVMKETEMDGARAHEVYTATIRNNAHEGYSYTHAISRPPSSPHSSPALLRTPRPLLLLILLSPCSCAQELTGALGETHQAALAPCTLAPC